MSKLTGKNHRKAITIIVAVSMLAAMLSGCGRNNSDGDETQSHYAAQTIQLPDDIGNIDFSNVAFYNDRMYFTAMHYEFADAGQTYGSFVNSIHSMNADGADVVELSGYEPPAKPPEDATGNVRINALGIDDDGNLWVAESWNFYTFDAPEDFDPENDDHMNYYVDLGSGSAVRKLDSTGAEMLLAQTDYISVGQDFQIGSLAVDGAGNVYLSAVSYGETVEAVVYVLDDFGELMFELKLGNRMGFGKELVRMPDGGMAYFGNLRDVETGYYSQVPLQRIDLSKKALGETVDHPIYGDIHQGSGGFDILFSHPETLYGYTFGDEEAVKILNWADSNVSYGGTSNIHILTDGRIVCARTVYDIENGIGTASNELLFFTKTSLPDNAGKTILNFAAFGLIGDIRNAVAEFNRGSAEYFIQVTDYEQYSTEDDWSAGLRRLSTEIISGSVPDIIELSNLPYREYVAKGLLTDLYPLIDSDPDFERGDVLESVLRASEIDGRLYQVFPSFFIDTIIGHPSVVGADLGWGIDEFAALLAAYPDADAPLGEWMTKSRFLATAAMYSIDDYLDWDSGTTRFDSPEFVRLMELANSFPADPDWGSGAGRAYATEEETLMAGRQLMMRLQIHDFQNLIWGKAVFGGEMAIKGFPAATGSGNSLVTNISLGITEKSEHKAAAWSFVRAILNKGWQLERGAFPTNREAFEQFAQTALETDFESGNTRFFSPGAPGGEYGFANVPIKNLTQDDVLYITGVIIDSASVTVGFGYDEAITNIIVESAADYFGGASSAQDTAKVIQSRVSLLVSERS